MSLSARNNSHSSSACKNCRKRKRRCSGSGPTCAFCAEKHIQCEWPVDDGRRIGRKLQLENASLKAEIDQLREEVQALRAGALAELSYYATQMPPYLDGEYAAPALQMNARQQISAHADFVMPLNGQLPGSTADARAALQEQTGAVEATVEPTVEATRAHLNVFGPTVAPLSTAFARPEGWNM